MDKKTNKPAPNARHLDATLLHAAHDPTVGDLIAAARAGAFVDTTPSRCFEHFRAQAEAVPTEGLPPFRGAPLLMHDNVKRALVVAEPAFPAAAARLRAPRIQEVYELPSLVLGLQFAAGRVPGDALSRGTIGALLTEQTPWRRLMLAYLDVVSDPLLNLVPRERVAAIREGKGPLDMAQDFVAIPGVFAEFASELEGKQPFRAEQIARLESVGATLLQQMRPGAAAKVERVRGPEAVLCDQFGALVTARFELLLELAVLGFGRVKAEAEMPALHAAVRAPKAESGEAKPDAAKKVEKKGKATTATKTDEVKQDAKPVAPPARPSAPPPN
jgi:hypothetical protein